MKKNSKIGILSLSLLLGTLVGCGGGIPARNTPDANTPALDVSKKVADFSNGASEEFFAPGGYGNGSPFAVEWSSEQVKTEDGKLSLSIAENAPGAEYPYLGAEYRSYSFYGYGDYATKMKPSKDGGTASTYFLYTGEWDSESKHPSTGENDTKNPDNLDGVHDEIDIEFLGKDTTKVQFNYFTAGKGGNEFMYDLGFDASKEYHEYGFRWTEDKIIWFVDGKAVYQAVDNIPSHPGRIITNYWCGDSVATGWMGNYTHSEQAKGSEYQWFSATGEAKKTSKEASGSTEEEGTGSGINWANTNASEMSVSASDDVYTVALAEDKKSVGISYSAVKGASYKNVTLGIPSGMSDATAVSFEVENKGTEDVTLRTDVNASTKHGANNITAINKTAYQDGKSITTDLDWGGSVATIKAGTKSTVEVVFEGTPANLMFMIDSAKFGDSATHAGNIEVSNFKFNGTGTAATPDPVDTPDPTPEVTAPAATPVEGFDEVSTLNVKAKNDCYLLTVSNESKAFEVAYANVGGASYQNIELTIPEGKSLSQKVAFEVENKGANAVTFRVDVEAATSHGANNIVCINKSATANGQAIATDLDWGGSTASIAAGTKSVIVVEFEGEATALKFFIDSSTYGSTASNTGDVVVSNIRYAGEQSATPTPSAATTLALSGAGYVCANSNGVSTITYEAIEDNSYMNVTADISSLVGENNTISFKVKNNGEESVQLFIGVGSTVGNDIVSKVTNTGGFDYFDESANRPQFNIAPGAEKVITMTFTNENIDKIIIFINSCWAATTSTHTNGNLVISEVVFSTVA